MKTTSKKRRLVSAESIARQADNGDDISSYFTNNGKMMPPLNLGIDLSQNVLEELSQAAKKLNISRQTLIKRFIREGLDEHYHHQKGLKAG